MASDHSIATATSTIKNKGTSRLIRRLALYEEECHQLLCEAYRKAKANEDAENQAAQVELGNNRVPIMPTSTLAAGEDTDGNSRAARHYWTVSSSDDEDADSPRQEKDGDREADSSSESSDNSSSGGEGDEEESTVGEGPLATVSEGDEQSDMPLPLADINGGVPISIVDARSRKGKIKKKAPSSRHQKRQLQAIQQHSQNLIQLDFALCEPPPTSQDPLHVFPAAALLPKADLQQPSVASKALAFQTLSEMVRSQRGYVVILLLQSGRFAGGVFEAANCVVHRALQHYTVRRGQGKAQSSQDQKRRAKSVGSQLRRAGEQSLKEDVQETIVEWREYVANARLVFVACPKTMQSTLFFTDKSDESRAPILSKDDDRIRKIPFDAGRPTFESVKIVHQVMLGVEVRAVDASCPPADDVADPVPLTKPPQDDNVQQEKDKESENNRVDIDLPLTPIHEASKDGNLVVLLNLLRQNDEDVNSKVDVINQRAGYDCMTPLHFAAESTTVVDPTTAAACVSTLLVQGRADPTRLDARGRVPYFLATHDKVREAFRKARAVLGEAHCDWETGAKVGPPLTEDDLAARKEKEAEKKRRKKARQKDKKSVEDAQTQEMEERRKAEEEKQRLAEEAKRVRDGLEAKSAGGNICDYCQKKCVGKKRQQMFLRLDYKYCSSDCVNAHKRELMAAAALSRFGGS